MVDRSVSKGRSVEGQERIAAFSQHGQQSMSIYLSPTTDVNSVHISVWLYREKLLIKNLTCVNCCIRPLEGSTASCKLNASRLKLNMGNEAYLHIQQTFSSSELCCWIHDSCESIIHSPLSPEENSLQLLNGLLCVHPRATHHTLHWEQRERTTTVKLWAIKLKQWV